MNKKAEWIEWLGLLAGPIVWLLQFQTRYALVRFACAHQNSVSLHAASSVALSMVIAAGIACAVHLRHVPRDASDGSPEARRRFMSLLGIWTNALFGLVIVGQAIPGFILNPCQ